MLFLVFPCNIKYFDFFSDISKLSKAFPSVDMVFSNGQKLSLSPENYLFRVYILVYLTVVPLNF